jgi:hypothetical protein
MRYDIEVVEEEAFCAYHVGGVYEIGEGVRIREVSLTDSGAREL